MDNDIYPKTSVYNPFPATDEAAKALEKEKAEIEQNLPLYEKIIATFEADIEALDSLQNIKAETDSDKEQVFTQIVINKKLAQALMNQKEKVEELIAQHIK